jgi:hypothetical protein
VDRAVWGQAAFLMLPTMRTLDTRMTRSVDSDSSSGKLTLEVPKPPYRISAGLYNLENLASTDSLPEWGAYLIAAPIKLA